MFVVVVRSTSGPRSGEVLAQLEEDPRLASCSHERDQGTR